MMHDLYTQISTNYNITADLPTQEDTIVYSEIISMYK